jgi:hypothetical protein
VFGAFLTDKPQPLCSTPTEARTPGHADNPVKVDPLVTDGHQEVYRASGGYLLRVKPVQCDEGGVSAGFAVLSVPNLV